MWANGRNTCRPRYRCGKCRKEIQPGQAIEQVAGQDKSLSFKRCDWRSILSSATERSNTRIGLMGFDREREFRFDEPYIDMMCWADMHMGDMYTDYDAIVRDVNRMLEAKRLKVAIVGDAIDNFHSSKLLLPMLEQVLSPNEQKTLLLNILDELIRAGKLMVIVLGNHEMFDLRSSGDSIFNLLDFGGVPICYNRLHTNVVVGDQEYRCDFMHKVKGSSMYNVQHGNARHIRENCPDADVVVSAHTHSPGFEYCIIQGRPRIMIKTGTSKGADNFSWSGWPDGQAPYAPVVRLFGGSEKKMRHIHGLDEIYEIGGVK